VTRREAWALGGILVVGILLRFVGLGALALIGDESYYWLWSRHPDWAYYDHPAGVALLVRTSTALGGSSEWGVRWLNALLGTACAALTYGVGRRMVSRRAGLFAAALVAVGAPYLITSRFVYTDVPFLLLMLLNLAAFWRLAQEQEPRPGTAVAFGVSLALLFNTKYSAYLYAGALAAGMLVDHRRLLARPTFWAGAVIGALGLAPVVAWNAAHDWASFRWQLSHATTNVTGSYSLLGNARHALAYLTGPLVVAALLGVGRVRTPAGRLLSLVALFLLLPVAISPANSPRNLASGLVPLLLLAGAHLPTSLSDRRRQALAAALGCVVLTTAIYGVGTVVDLSHPSPWPSSSVVTAIRKDAAGWRDLGPVLANLPNPIFTLDYSVAAQVRYYAGRPAYTAWGQYHLWGIPNLEDVVILSQEYLPPDLVSSRLREAFEVVEGPEILRATERGATKEMRIWQVQGLVWDQETFLQRFDFLTLLEATQ
jgi:hypothetical protein